MRGLAQAALKRVDAEAAEQLLLQLLGRADSQRPQPKSQPQNDLSAFEHILGLAPPSDAPSTSQFDPPAEHWAHGDYGWLLFGRGDYQVRNSAWLICRA